MRIFALALLAAAGACGLRQVETADGASTTLVGPAVALPACGDAGVRAVKATQFGLWTSGAEHGLGFKSAEFACWSPECAVLVWADSGTDAEALARELKGLEGVCVVN